MKNNIISLEEYIDTLKVGSIKRITYLALQDYLKLFELEVSYFETRDIFLIHDTKDENDVESVKTAYSLPTYFREKIESELCKETITKEQRENYIFVEEIIRNYFNKYDE